jgi:hypothetical protein
MQRLLFAKYLLINRIQLAGGEQLVTPHLPNTEYSSFFSIIPPQTQTLQIPSLTT